MKINIRDIDETQFMCHQHVINGEVCTLVQPQNIAAKWTQQNKHLRSSLWNSDGELISAGFPKFTNLGENPEHFPVPTSLKNTTAVAKVDGSLLIVSKYKGNVILRTRGTTDATRLENGPELEIFKQTILPKLDPLFNNKPTWTGSVLFEWVSPKQKIVISYGDAPNWYLIGCVNHSDYSLVTQFRLDQVAKELELNRPETYSFNSINEIVDLVSKWEGKEGVCLYSKDGQVIHKLKSDWYLIRHRLKDEFRNFERVLDFYLKEGCPSFHEFQAKVAAIVDWEVANQIIGDISTCVDAWKEVQAIIAGMTAFVEPLRLISARKIVADKIISSYGITNRASFCFKIYDGKPLDDKDLKKLFYQVTKS
jgi:RNA ligase